MQSTYSERNESTSLSRSIDYSTDTSIVFHDICAKPNGTEELNVYIVMVTQQGTITKTILNGTLEFEDKREYFILRK